MAESKLHSIMEDERERAILVGLIVYPTTREDAQEHIDELELLADTAGADTVAKVLQSLPRPDGAHFIGKGKTEEIKLMIEEDESISLIVIDDDLTPVQTRNLERIFERKVIDRSGLILDIFAKHARSSEARTQVELAQLQYLLPRLTGQWTHLSKQYGGIGTKGPGETQIETDRRMIRVRIAHLREKLEKIEVQHETQRKGRAEMFRVALVGYTNAGKSTLMNELAGAGVHAEDRLFATLDTTVRSVELAPRRIALISDTVGFIRKLPPHLIASFRTTLSEVREADLLLHVVDASSSAVVEHIAVVQQTLEEIGAKDVPALMVFNKVDLLEVGGDVLSELLRRHPEGIPVSAARGMNIGTLRERLVTEIEEQFILRTVRVPMARYHLMSKIHGHADVLSKDFDEEYAYIRLRFGPKSEEQVMQILAGAQAEVVKNHLPVGA